ncbi:MAG: hypothetical protein Barrevirus1_18 [Barrevirus sp.]|uniref:Uncharacterized protein n=1 Tax=Barrevirus sp. TaxID=2487763 RepID=A0A3G4ZPI1_9VIRU|nr:MAG: hypothetical protein Barrevirus1_18 [Barrevirus sp.]
MAEPKRKCATISLSYFKSGDDVARCLIKNPDDTVNTKETIGNHIALLESVIQHLKSINDLIPEASNCTIHGDTHYISITGPENIIDELVTQKLAYIDDWNEEEGDDEQNFDDEEEGEIIEGDDVEGESEENEQMQT